MNDDELHNKLTEWEVDLPEDRQFPSAVWREIAMRESSSPISRFRELLDHLFTPRFAIPVGVIALIATALLASFNGLEAREETWESLATAYRHSIDPISHTESPAGK